MDFNMRHTKILHEIHAFPRIIECTIPDFFHSPKQLDYYKSPAFFFWQGTYRFVVTPYGSKRLPDMMVLMLQQEIRQCNLKYWELEIYRADGKVLRKCGGWNVHDSNAKMKMFIPISEIQRECSGIDFLRIRCVLYCEEALSNPERVTIHENTESQTESTLGTDDLSCDLEELLRKGDDSDVTIRVEDKEFEVHKNILRARTPVFTSMFKHKMSETITNIVDINDCDATAFQEFLHYLYTGRLSKLSTSNIFSLHKIADKYQVLELMAYCLEYIKNNLSVEIFCDTLILAMQYNEEELIDMVIRFFSENMSEIKNTKEWKNFSIENSSGANWLLQEALELQKLKVSSVLLNMPVGTIEEIHKFPRILEWRIPNFFQLPKKVGYSIASPSFKFREYTCGLVAQPNGTNNFPNTMLFTLKGFGKAGTTYWQLEVYDTDDIVLRKFGGYKEDGSEIEMSMFIPVNEVRTGCFSSSFLKMRCILHCEETLNYPGKESYAHTGSQTETISRTDKLPHDLQELLISGNDSNIVIRVEAKEFKVHKNILAARSLLFSSIFKDEVSGNIVNAIDIDDCDATTFREFLHYLYSGTLTVYTLNSVFNQYKLANKYQVNGLKKCCMEYIKNNLSIYTFCEIAMFSVQCNEEKLMDMVTIFYSNNVTEIENTEKWCNFLLKNPSESNEIRLKALELQRDDYSNSKTNLEKELTQKHQTITSRILESFCILN